jgi:hypothetical protein
MRIPLYIHIIILVLTLAAVFWFPWLITLVFLFLSGLVFPPAAAGFGVLEDILYYPGSGLPIASIIGCGMALIATLVRHFVKTRIM